MTFRRVILNFDPTQQQFGPIRPFKGLFANTVFFISMHESASPDFIRVQALIYVFAEGSLC